MRPSLPLPTSPFPLCVPSVPPSCNSTPPPPMRVGFSTLVCMFFWFLPSNTPARAKLARTVTWVYRGSASNEARARRGGRKPHGRTGTCLQQVRQCRIPIGNMTLTRSPCGDDVTQGAQALIDVLRLAQRLPRRSRLQHQSRNGLYPCGVWKNRRSSPNRQRGFHYSGEKGTSEMTRHQTSAGLRYHRLIVSVWCVFLSDRWFVHCRLKDFNQARFTTQKSDDVS